MHDGGKVRWIRDTIQHTILLNLPALTLPRSNLFLISPFWPTRAATAGETMPDNH